MLRGVAVLQTDGTVGRQVRLMRRHHPTVIDTRPPARSYRHFLPRRDLPRLADQLAPARGRVVMLGTGDFHHLTAALLRVATAESVSRPEGPAAEGWERGIALVVVDAHPEWSLAPPGYLHCGSWLAEALQLGRVQAVALVGVGPLEAAGLLAPSLVQGVARPAREGRLRVYPARRSTVRELYRALWWPDPLVSLEDGLSAALADLAAYLGGLPVYLSIDKDVVLRDQLPGPWGGGELCVEAFLELVEAVAATLRLVGADICGEHVAPIPWPGDGDPARRLHEQVNLRLLATLLAGAGRPTSLHAA